MTLFFYLFSVALGVALGIAFGSSWIRDRRGGKWSVRAIIVLAICSILFGLIVGYSLDVYAAYARST